MIASMVLLFGTLGCANENPDIGIDQSRPPGQAAIQEGLTGRICDPENHPVEGAFIQPRSLDDPSPPIPEIAILSNSKGQFTWHLQPGHYEISVSAEGYAPAKGQVTVQPEKVTVMNVTLQPDSSKGQSED